MSSWEEERETERREHARQLEEIEKRRQEDLQQLRQEFLSMLQATNGHAQVPQVLVKLFARMSFFPWVLYMNVCILS
jgi:hypothetical protein